MNANVLFSRPDTTAYRRQTPIATTDADKKDLDNHQSTDFTKATKQPVNDSTNIPYDRVSHPEELVKSSQNAQSDLFNNTDEFMESYSGDELEKFRTEILQRTQKVDDRKDDVADFEEPQFEDDDLFSAGRFVSNRPSKDAPNALGHGASPRPNKLLGLDSRQNLVQNQPITGDHLNDHDDDLSTIPEASEPSTPTVYSFQTGRSFDDGSESSRTIGTDDEILSSYDDTQSPTIGSQDVTPLNSIDAASSDTFGIGADEPQFAKRQDESSKYDSFQKRGHEIDDRFLKSSDILPATSYTVLNSEMSVEAAKAAGLPIIGGDFNADDIAINSFDSAVLDGKLTENVGLGIATDAIMCDEDGHEIVAGNWERNSRIERLPNGRVSYPHDVVDYLGSSSGIVSSARYFDSQQTQSFDAFEGALSRQSGRKNSRDANEVQHTLPDSKKQVIGSGEYSGDVREKIFSFRQFGNENETAVGVSGASFEAVKGSRPMLDNRKNIELKVSPLNW